MNYVTGNDRNQVVLRALDDFIDDSSNVRVVDAFVNGLNLKKYNFLKRKLNKLF